MKSKHKYPCLPRQGQQRDLHLNSIQSKTIYGTNSNNLIGFDSLKVLQNIANRVIISLEGFWFLLEDFFGRLYVCMVQYLSFHNSCFCLKKPPFFSCKWQGQSVIHPLYPLML